MRTCKASNLFNSVYHVAYDYMSRCTAGTILQTLEAAGLCFDGAGVTLAEAAERIGCLEENRPRLHWALAFLTQERLLQASGGRYALADKQAAWLPGQLNVSIEASVKLVDYVAEHYVALLAGKANPVRVLFNAKGTALWEEYFNNSHDLYAVHNQWAAEAVAAHLEQGGTRVLELGAGYGSGTSAVLAECAMHGIAPKAYVMSDISPLLLKRSLRAVAERFPGVPLRSAAVDVNRLADDPPEAGGFDLIFGVNVVHCASDLGDTLSRLRAWLRPGGRLLLSECVRADYDALLHQEFIFSLLPGFENRRHEQQMPPAFGFLRAEDWTMHLRLAGYQSVRAHVNQGRILGAILEGVNGDAG